MKNTIDQIKERSYRPTETKLDFLIELIRSKRFREDFHFDSKITVSSKEPDENWSAEFIPWPMIDAFSIHQSLTDLAQEVRERGGDADPIWQLADKYLYKLEDLTDYYSKFSYDDVSSLMFISGGAISEYNPIILEVKPRVVLDLMQ